MATLSSLSVILKANTSGFASGMKRASSSVVNFGKSVLRTTKRVAGFALKLATLGGGVGITLLTKRSLESADALAKMAGRLNTTTEALSRLQFAGRQSGINVATMNMAMQRMSRRASEAAQGTGEAVKALKELGIDAKALIALPLDKQMEQLADAIATGVVPAERLRLAFKLFDSEGVALLNLLNEGATGVRKLTKESDRLGNTIGSIDAIKVEEVTNAAGKAKDAFGGFVNRIVFDLLPAFEALADKSTEFWVRTREQMGPTIDTIETFAFSMAGMIDETATNFRDMWNDVTSEALGSFSTILKGLGEVADEVGAVANKIFGIPQLDAKFIRVSTGEVVASSSGVQSNSITRAAERLEALSIEAGRRAETERPAITGATDALKSIFQAIRDQTDDLTARAQQIRFAREEAKFFAGDPSGVGDAVGKAIKFELPGAIERGSAAEQRLVSQRKQTDTQDTILQTTKQQLRETVFMRRSFEIMQKTLTNFGVSLEPI